MVEHGQAHQIRRATPSATSAAWWDLDWMWVPADHLRGLWGDAKPSWVVTNFSSGRLSPSMGEVDDLSLRVCGSAADRVLGLIGDRFQTALAHRQVAMDLFDEHFGSMTEIR